MTTLIGLTTLLLALSGSVEEGARATYDAALWVTTEAAPHRDPLASVPSSFTIRHSANWSVIVAPIGPDGPPAPRSFDALSANVRWDREKADRIAPLHAKGGGVVVTVMFF